MMVSRGVLVMVFVEQGVESCSWRQSWSREESEMAVRKRRSLSVWLRRLAGDLVAAQDGPEPVAERET